MRSRRHRLDQARRWLTSRPNICAAAISPPVLFASLWLACVALAQIRILDLQRPWSRTTWLVVLVVPGAFAAGGLAAALFAPRIKRAPPGVHASMARIPFRIALGGMLGIGFAELVHQFAAARTIPLLAENIDRARYSLPEGPTVVLIDLLSVVSIVGLTYPRRLLARSAAPYLLLALTGFAGVALLGSRSLLAFPVAVILVARMMHWGIRRPLLLACIAVLLLNLGATLYYLRFRQAVHGGFDYDLFNHVLKETPFFLLPLIPVYLSLALNFEALARIVDYFPANAPYGHGVWSVDALDRVFHNARDIRDIAIQLSPPWNSTTFAGPLWADGGLPWVLGGLGVLGFVVTLAVTYARRVHVLRYTLVAAYLLCVALYGVVENLTQRPDFIVYLLALFWTGSVADSQAQQGEDQASLKERGDASPRARRWILGSAAGLAALLGGGAAMKVLLPQSVSAVPPGDTYQLSEPDARTLRASISRATDTEGEQDTPPLWAFVRVGRGSLVVHPFQLRNGRVVAERSFILRAGHRFLNGPLLTSVAGDHRLSWLLLARLADKTHLRLELYRLRPNHELRFAREIGVPLGWHGHLELALATYSGTVPDLFLVDSSRTSRAHLLILSGESRFSKSILATDLPLVIPPDNWNVFVVRRGPGPPDVVLVKRRISQSTQIELHALSGISGYKDFSLHQATPLLAADSAAYELAVGVTSPARAVLFATTRSAPFRVLTVPLG